MIERIGVAGENLCEDRIGIRYIPKFLGHSSLKTTTLYLYLTKSTVDKIKSPLDIMVDENN
jgi:site-specific recombinase XerD